MKESIMSFFKAPIRNQVPNAIVDIRRLHILITSDERLRERTLRVREGLADAGRFRQLKQGLLPYVTPAGVFSYRREECLLVPSGDLVIDIDHLPSAEAAAQWRDTLFADERLRPDLAFVSPGGTGVKLFVPYRLSPAEPVEHSFDTALAAAWDYLAWRHELRTDTSNADLCRACFLCHDPEARIR